VNWGGLRCHQLPYTALARVRVEVRVSILPTEAVRSKRADDIDVSGDCCCLDCEYAGPAPRYGDVLVGKLSAIKRLNERSTCNAFVGVAIPNVIMGEDGSDR
jgi:hypothetical protein